MPPSTPRLRRPVAPLAALLLLLLGFAAGVPTASARDDISLAFWNVENLFDAVNDPGDHDDSLADWYTESIYQKKLENLAEIINAMNDGKGPDIMGFAELENGLVLNDLVAKLSTPDDYYIVHVEGGDHRSIEVGLISRFPVKKVTSHYVYEGTRDMLQVDLDMGDQPLTVLVNHWKSRYGGVEETAPWRLVCASRTRQVAKSIIDKNAGADIVMMGDFNDGPNEDSVTRALRAINDPEKVLSDAAGEWFYNPTADLVKEDVGSHWYRGKWEFLDQMVVSRGLLLDDGVVYVPGSLATFNPSNRLMKDGHPFRFGGKNETERGYSDHLPLVARLSWRKHLTGAADVVPAKRHSLIATLYYQSAAEVRALYLQGYAAARRQVEADMQAHPEVQKRAVIVDVDETVLDNSPYQAGLLLSGKTYPEGWVDWVNSGSAEPTPGAVAFLQFVANAGAEVFYVTNRKAEGEQAGTIANLKRHGMPNADAEHVICRTFTRSKEQRRQDLVAEGYHIAVLIGDNLGDFASAFEGGTPEARRAMVDELSTQFGNRFIILPNSMYGDWEGAVYGYNYMQSPAALDAARVKALNPW